MLEAKADVDVQDEEGMTALMYACRNGLEACAHELLESTNEVKAVAKKELTSKDGKTAADFAITSVRRAQTAAAVKICELLGVAVPELPSGRRASTRRRSAYPTRPPSRSVG